MWPMHFESFLKSNHYTKNTKSKRPKKKTKKLIKR